MEVTMLRRVVSVAALVILWGCGISQTVRPVERFDGRDVCVIENTSVKAGFLESYKRALAAKGYSVKQLDRTASIHECPTTSTYSAAWGWDFALYMVSAEIRVYKSGKQIGVTLYDARRAGLNTGKFVNADNKIVELVNELFPGSAEM
jgi:hypothetical protein